MFTTELLPAAHGDAILVEYGSARAPHRILMDGGPHTTYDALRQRLLAIPKGKRHFDLVIVSHIDTDHIDGILRLLQDDSLGITIRDLWFNGYRHLAAKDVMGGLQGEFLEVLIEDREIPWNAAFKAGPIVVPPDGDLPVVRLPGGATLTLLSPGKAQLQKLRREWDATLRAAGFKPGDREAARAQLARRKEYAPPEDVMGTQADTSAANGSSLAVLLEFKGNSLLLAGDAFREVLEESLTRLAETRGVEAIQVDAFKLSHHGSFSNLSPRLLRIAPAAHYLISTNGDKFHHPDASALTLLLKERQGTHPILVFNYDSPSTAPWKRAKGSGTTFEAVYGGRLVLA